MKTPSLRSTLYGLFLSTALMACGNARQARIEEQKQKATIDTEQTAADSTVIAADNYDAQMKVLKARFPKDHAKVQKRPAKYLLMASPLVGGVPSQFSTKRAKQLIDIVERENKPGFDRARDIWGMAVDVIELFEGYSATAYPDSENKLTIGHGVLMPTPGDKNQQDLIQEIRDAAGGKVLYKDIHKKDGAPLTRAGGRALTEHLLKTRYNDEMERNISRALGGYDDFDSRSIPAGLKVMMMAMVWQCPDVLSRDPDITNPYLRTMSEKDGDLDDKKQAFADLAFYYMDTKLLKNHNDDKFSDEHRIILAARPALMYVAAYGDAHGALPQAWLVSEFKAMARDQNNTAEIVLMGNLSCSVADILFDEKCGFRNGGKNSIILPGNGYVFRQDDDVLTKEHHSKEIEGSVMDLSDVLMAQSGARRVDNTLAMK